MRIALFILLIGGLGGLPVAATSETIHGCVKNGKLRIVASASDCKKKESPISWNAAGEPGPQGEPGEPGEPGAPGEPAPSGTTLHVFGSNGIDLGVLAGRPGSALAYVWLEALQATIFLDVGNPLSLTTERATTRSTRSEWEDPRRSPC